MAAVDDPSATILVVSAVISMVPTIAEPVRLMLTLLLKPLAVAVTRALATLVLDFKLTCAIPLVSVIALGAERDPAVVANVTV